MRVDSEEHDSALERLLTYLKENRGFDFTNYKRASLTRRIRKRMAQVGRDDFEAYEDYLEVHPHEFAELFNTILINVTAFFRDRASWDFLAEQIVPRILADRPPGADIRVWSAGCASGEEACSLAMLMGEVMGLDACRERVKIYATDVDEQALEQARRSSYGAATLTEVDDALRDKYFDHKPGEDLYHFRQDLRRLLVFGRHDLMHDAPISRLDLLVCRNTLIYFNREAQDRIAGHFHFGLRPTGYLFLGRAEMLLGKSDLFEPVEMKSRVFRRVTTDEPRRRMEALVQASRNILSERKVEDRQLEGAAFEAAPTAHVIVDDRGVLAMANHQARSRLGVGLKDLGRPFGDLELSYRPVELRSLIDRAREEREPVTVQNVAWATRDRAEPEYLDVVVTPLWGNDNRWLGVGIHFHVVTERHEMRWELEQARHEIETTYEELQSTNEELETSNEELQSTVEELQTSNEELQSSNEEMETMNEELQSVNAELQTVNDQLQRRTSDLNQANAFLESVLASVDVGVVAIDRDFRVTLWNERAQDLWGLRADEVLGRSLLDLDIGLPVGKLQKPVERFLGGTADTGKVVLEARNRRGQLINCYVTRTIRRDRAGEPEGVVLLMEEER